MASKWQGLDLNSWLSLSLSRSLTAFPYRGHFWFTGQLPLPIFRLPISKLSYPTSLKEGQFLNPSYTLLGAASQRHWCFLFLLLEVILISCSHINMTSTQMNKYAQYEPVWTLSTSLCLVAPYFPLEMNGPWTLLWWKSLNLHPFLFLEYISRCEIIGWCSF